MAFSGYLIKVKKGSSWVEVPLKYMKAEDYCATPNQRMEASAGRSTTGYLHRTTCAHTATKVEFETPVMNNTDIVALNKIFSDAFTNVNQRNITIRYYDSETDSYKDADCYMPDVQYPILRIEGNTIWYKNIRYAFIEY